MSSGGYGDENRKRIFDNITTADLEAEIARRREAERLAAEAERARLRVTVWCPHCKGSGVRGGFETACGMCAGSRKITAVRVE